MRFYDIFKQECEKASISPTALLKELHISTSKLTAWKNGSMPNSEYLIPISERLNVSIDYLITGKEKSPLAEQTAKELLSSDEQELMELYKSLSEKDKIRVIERARALYDLAYEQVKKPEFVPLYYVDNRVSAGLGASLSDYEQGATVYVPATPESRRADFILKISGDSMEPKFYDGEYVLVRSQQEIEIGQIGIFGINGDGFIKKLGKRDLISLNSKYDPIPISEETTCFGLVLGTTEIISK